MKKPIYLCLAALLILLPLTACKAETIDEIKISPAAGNYLRDMHDEPLKIMLINVQVERGISDEDYFPA